MSPFQYNRFSISPVIVQFFNVFTVFNWIWPMYYDSGNNFAIKTMCWSLFVIKLRAYYLQGVTNNGLLQIFPCKMLPKIRIHRINSLYKHLDLVLNMDQLVLLSLQLELKQKTDIEIIH